MSALTRLLGESASERGPIIFLSGAGISAESGIPTFRGKEGYWTVGAREYHPQEMATSTAFRELPREVWRWYLYRRAVCRAAAANDAHRALVELEQALGDDFLLVTQNVDGLHLRAGQSRERTYEVHGNIDFSRCANGCSMELDLLPDTAPLLDRETPLSDEAFKALRCPRCKGPARPHVLWFDESYDEELFRFESSLRATMRARLLVTIGTSGSTNLPNQMVSAMVTRGAAVVDINPDDNPFARAAVASGGLWLQTSASEGLSLVAAALGELAS